MNWGGWAGIGAILMKVAGAFHIVSGIYGLFNDEWIVLGYNGFFIVDVTGLAVWMIVIGVVLMLGGIAVVRGSTLGRRVGVVAASLAILSQLFMLPVHPVWSTVLIVLYVLALVGLVAPREPTEVSGGQASGAAEVNQVATAAVAAEPVHDKPAAAPPAAAPAEE